MLPLLELLALLATAFFVVLAQQSCNPANDKLDPLTHDFDSDCNVTEYCSAPAPQPNATTATTSGTCVPRVCRQDEWPFGYGNVTLPPLCDDKQYCPDQGNGCKSLVAQNGACELNRDDECEPPSDPATRLKLANPTNNNGSICLNLVCMYANVESGQACNLSNTVFTGYESDGTAYTDVVTRDNCLTGLYCEPTSLTCVSTLAVGANCTSDRSCSTSICSTTTGTCSPTPGKPHPTPVWGVALLTIAVLIALGGMVWGLLRCDKSARARRRAERAQAWAEQRQLRERLGEVLEKRGKMEREWSKSSTSLDSVAEEKQ
ncbi:hypothetical protein JCM5296_007038 [Sporobolomyces johnsonii]